MLLIISDRLECTKYLPKYRCGKTDISGEKVLLLTLWYLGNTERLGQISDKFDILLSAAHRTLLNFINFILSLRQEYIKWPSPKNLL
ncbi:hypothetical protein QE152_g9043 [Popillia japonica]|uniref:Transposase Helix-turn-helix domain-containing protein n=1 Tax=Popillia japonica TaxID=7064 RepID=A0AAW1M1C1_POPJA